VLGCTVFRSSLCQRISFTRLALLEIVASALSLLGVSGKAPRPLPADVNRQRRKSFTTQVHAMGKVRKLLAMTVMLFVLMAAEGRARSAVDGFNPDANKIARSLAVQADGKILVGGDFIAVDRGVSP
jgi:hypothetical protein